MQNSQSLGLDWYKVMWLKIREITRGNEHIIYSCR